MGCCGIQDITKKSFSDDSLVVDSNKSDQMAMTHDVGTYYRGQLLKSTAGVLSPIEATTEEVAAVAVFTGELTAAGKQQAFVGGKFNLDHIISLAAENGLTLTADDAFIDLARKNGILLVQG